MAQRDPSFDLVLIGGGLANGLVAHRLSALRPELRVAIVERGASLGGDHTWSFHATDVPPATQAWLDPFVAHRWASQRLAFPGRNILLPTPYRSVTSERFDAIISGLPNLTLYLQREARAIGPRQVVLDDGITLDAGAVIDGRGVLDRGALDLAWQKFVGSEVRLAEPHGLTAPVIMDATVEQRDGFRFVYLLPFGPDRLLIEDTHYSDGPGFSVAGYLSEIEAYATARGWRIAEVLRTEKGALPIALGGDPARLFDATPGVAKVGLAAGLFHPTTGYTLPDAARLADKIAAAPDLSAPALARLTRTHALDLWRRRRFFRLINRMLFRAAGTAGRRQILSHFYRLPAPLVERFYGDRLTPLDKLRILSGRPPVPISKAIKAILSPKLDPVEGNP